MNEASVAKSTNTLALRMASTISLPQVGALNVTLVQPVCDTGFAEAFHERQDAVAIGPGIADEDISARHGV